MADLLGEIRIFPVGFAPSGWAVCDGRLLDIKDNKMLFSVLGTAYGGDGVTTFGLPDLRGRTQVHPGNGVNLGQKGGEEAHTLSAAEMPAHTHTPFSGSGGAVLGNPQGNTWGTIPNGTLYADNADKEMAPTAIAAAGAGLAHDNMQPYLVLNYCIAIDEFYISRLPFLGEIRMYAGKFAPNAWEFCNGQVLPIATNEYLFSDLGHRYGGDGTPTFALPDLRGRAPMHVRHEGPEATLRPLGKAGGSAAVTLASSELPAHNHGAGCVTSTATQANAVNAVWANTVGGKGGGAAVGYQASANTKMNPQALRSSGGNQPHNNMQPYQGINFIILVKGVPPSKPPIPK